MIGVGVRDQQMRRRAAGRDSLDLRDDGSEAGTEPRVDEHKRAIRLGEEDVASLACRGATRLRVR
jgi:hypothetical protein